MNVTEMTEMVTIDDRRPSSTKSHLTKTTGNNEWYTPDKYIEAARQAMGSIDCDPASSAEANEFIRAATYYTQDDDGRQKPWSGNVWLNPPYSRGLIGDFADAVAAKYEAGEIRQACVLVNNASDTEWYHRLLSTCSAVCMPKGRIRFRGVKNGTPVQGQVIFYLGPAPLAFAAVFRRLGQIVHIIGKAPDWTATHGQACDECKALIGDLERIEEEKRQAVLLKSYGEETVFG